MTPIEFPAAVGGYPTIVLAEHIETIERDYYYPEHCVLVLTSKRTIKAGCSPERAAQMIREASKVDLVARRLTDTQIDDMVATMTIAERDRFRRFARRVERAHKIDGAA